VSSGAAAAASHPNIAFIKYWGNRDDHLRLAANGSISMTLGGLRTHTRVRFDPELHDDQLTLNGRTAPEEARQRVSRHLDLIRSLSGLSVGAWVESENDVPAAAGLASSASAFASLTLAASAAASLELEPRDLSRLARRGSGSAARSIFGGFVEAYTGEADIDGYAQPIAPPEHWELVDWIVLASPEAKPVGSSHGHTLAATSPLQAARVTDAPRRLDLCRQAILERDFQALAEVTELDSNLMHAVMLTSRPPLMYWQPVTVELMLAVRDWRSQGLPVCYSVDAGPNVHCLCPAQEAERVEVRLRAACPQARVIRAIPGGPARLVTRQPS
jgi:diphosphomevalonate decarboxylase